MSADDGLLANTFLPVTSALTLSAGSTVASATGWRARFDVHSGSVPSSITAQYVARGFTTSPALAITNSTWPGNVDATLIVEQSDPINTISPVRVRGSQANYLVAGALLTRGPSDDPTNFATASTWLEIWDDYAGVAVASSATLDWTQMTVGRPVRLTAVESRSDPAAWAVLSRRWRLHMPFTITGGAAPTLGLEIGEPQFEFSPDTTLSPYAALVNAATQAGVASDTLAADQNDYLPPGGIAGLRRLRLTASGANRTLTGIIAGTDGQVITLQNMGDASSPYYIFLGYNSGLSQSPNRFMAASGAVSASTYALRPGQSVDILYDGPTGLWRLLSPGVFNTPGKAVDPTSGPLESDPDTSTGAGVAAAQDHGHAFTVPSDATVFLRGDGTWAAVSPSFATPSKTTPGAVSSAGTASTAIRSDAGIQSPGGVASISASKAIANTETQVVGFTVPANFCAAGTTFRICGAGTMSVSGLNSPTFRIRFGTTSLSGNIPTSIASGALGATSFAFEGLITVRTAGASGTVIGECVLWTDSSTTAQKLLLSSTAATVALDTTAQKIIELTFISGGAGDTYTWQVAEIEVVKM